MRATKVVHPYRSQRLFLLLLARTGVRLGEAIALKWGDVDLHGGFLEVRRNHPQPKRNQLLERRYRGKRKGS